MSSVAKRGGGSETAREAGVLGTGSHILTRARAREGAGGNSGGGSENVGDNIFKSVMVEG